MIRSMLFLLFFLCYFEVSAQSPCTKYAETIAVVNEQLAMKNPDAQLTFNKLRAARVHARDCVSVPAGEVGPIVHAGGVAVCVSSLQSGHHHCRRTAMALLLQLVKVRREGEGEGNKEKIGYVSHNLCLFLCWVLWEVCLVCVSSV